MTGFRPIRRERPHKLPDRIVKEQKICRRASRPPGRPLSAEPDPAVKTFLRPPAEGSALYSPSPGRQSFPPRSHGNGLSGDGSAALYAGSRKFPEQPRQLDVEARSATPNSGLGSPASRARSSPRTLIRGALLQRTMAPRLATGSSTFASSRLRVIPQPRASGAAPAPPAACPPGGYVRRRPPVPGRGPRLFRRRASPRPA